MHIDLSCSLVCKRYAGTDRISSSTWNQTTEFAPNTSESEIKKRMRSSRELLSKFACLCLCFASEAREPFKAQSESCSSRRWSHCRSSRRSVFHIECESVECCAILCQQVAVSLSDLKFKLNSSKVSILCVVQSSVCHATQSFLSCITQNSTLQTQHFQYDNCICGWCRKHLQSLVHRLGPTESQLCAGERPPVEEFDESDASHTS